MVKIKKYKAVSSMYKIENDKDIVKLINKVLIDKELKKLILLKD